MAVTGVTKVRSTRKLFKNAYAITMNPKGRRFTMMKHSAKKAGIKIKQYPGVRITEDHLQKGIPGVPKRYHDKPGTIGCFLAQKKLLEKLSKRDTDPNEGTLIVEDDALFPKDFYKRLKKIEPEIPDDWDLIYLNRFVEINPKEKRELYRKTFDKGRISKHVYKINNTYKDNSFGNWAYIVRNKTLKKKFLPHLKRMHTAIDIQYNMFADKANMYAIFPNITKLNKTTRSNRMNIDEKKRIV
jgi:GR25 family glycosyltransferase involved in LPS biosynthesis